MKKLIVLRTLNELSYFIFPLIHRQYVQSVDRTKERKDNIRTVDHKMK